MELQETSQHLENVKNHMLKESEYQKKFVDAINHDITTPVKFIAMLAQKLNEEEDLKIQKEYFEGIYQTSEELYKFTLNLKEYNNLYTAEIYTPEEFPIHEIFESKQKLFNEIAKLKNNHIEIQNKNTITCTVNKSIIACIVHNLIDNAVKYSSESIISLNAKEAADKIIIKIEDEGIGMSHEQLSYYNDLSRNNDDAAIQFKRYGLGLHMVINLIKKINAEIEFRKNTPSGTIIEINIYNQNR
jgi:K+-sensing histidine kinase KdpD